MKLLILIIFLGFNIRKETETNSSETESSKSDDNDDDDDSDYLPPTSSKSKSSLFQKSTKKPSISSSSTSSVSTPSSKTSASTSSHPRKNVVALSNYISNQAHYSPGKTFDYQQHLKCDVPINILDIFKKKLSKRIEKIEKQMKEYFNCVDAVTEREGNMHFKCLFDCNHILHFTIYNATLFLFSI